jgi:mRNA m6A methyltransferase catalytic subunit
LEFKSKKSLEYCDHCTRDRCQKARGHSHCNKKHFRAIINQKTDESFGNCPHLNACHNADCKLIHYVEEDQQSEVAQEKVINRERMIQAEWINCDLRFFDFKILGKFDVVMADPPWDIHMSLPYGTLKDKELLNLRVDILQDEGLIFLWVTGRAMELGR